MKHLESEDPFELVGVPKAMETNIDTDTETARCIIEEYALSGFTASEIADLFRSPSYSMLYSIYRRRGIEFVMTNLENVFGRAR